MSATDDYSAKYRNDSRSSEELIGLALSKDADADNDGFWHPVWALQTRLPLLLDRVKELSRAGDEKSREVAATLLGQNGVEHKVAVDECLDLLLEMLHREVSPRVLTDVTFALGHLRAPRSIEALLPLKQHAEADVRYALVHSLCGHSDERAIKALIELSADADRDVRNWSTFGLGSQVETDTPEIREALVARLIETDDEIRGEALVGLAERGDQRVIKPFLKELESHPDDTLRQWSLIGDTAAAIIRHASTAMDMAWLGTLEKLIIHGIGDQSQIEAAIQSCKADGR